MTAGCGWEEPAKRLRDVHKHVPPSPLASKSRTCQARTAKVSGSYEYYHYMHGGCNDVGWGCAYRSLQTLWSWYILQGFTDRPVPSHRCVHAQSFHFHLALGWGSRQGELLSTSYCCDVTWPHAQASLVVCPVSDMWCCPDSV